MPLAGDDAPGATPLTPEDIEGLLPTWVATRADLRWGKDKAGFRRLIHPNGICLAGDPTVTQASINNCLGNTSSTQCVDGALQ